MSCDMTQRVIWTTDLAVTRTLWLRTRDLSSWKEVES